MLNFIFKILFFIIHFQLKQTIQTSITYSPFKSYNALFNPNTIYGTGNQLHDISYRAYCTILCNVSSYSDDNCCIGETIQTLTCASPSTCKEIQNAFQNHVLKLTFSSYSILIIITCVIVCVIVYCLTKDPLYKKRNCIASFLLVFCAALIIPIIAIQIYACVNRKKIGEIFGADFSSCGVDKLLHSVEIKHNEKTHRQREGNETNKEVEMANQKYIPMSDEKEQNIKNSKISLD